MKMRRRLNGHFGKVYAMQWGRDSKSLLSAAQDGRLILWNAESTNKLDVVPLRSQWVMACALSPTGNLVCSGGLDSMCTVYRLPFSAIEEGKQRAIPKELFGHEGYVSSARFIDDSEILTSSGDSSCILWDVERKIPKHVFKDHTADVMSVSVCEPNKTFVSGSVDCTAKLWDHRNRKACVRTYFGHESDINSVAFFPDNLAFGTGSDDATCRLFDLRSQKQINQYNNDRILCGITSVDFSQSGRLLFAGYDDSNCYSWDVATGVQTAQMAGHEKRCSCLHMSPNGRRLATGSWDTLIYVWF